MKVTPSQITVGVDGLEARLCSMVCGCVGVCLPFILCRCVGVWVCLFLSHTHTHSVSVYVCECARARVDGDGNEWQGKRAREGRRGEGCACGYAREGGRGEHGGRQGR